MPPTRRPESISLFAAAARAIGKLAPHRRAAGMIAQRQRTISIWKVYHGLGESRGLMGHQGRELDSCHAVHAMAPASANWLHPSSARGLRDPRATMAPTLEPIASP